MIFRTCRVRGLPLDRGRRAHRQHGHEPRRQSVQDQAERRLPRQESHRLSCLIQHIWLHARLQWKKFFNILSSKTSIFLYLRTDLVFWFWFKMLWYAIWNELADILSVYTKKKYFYTWLSLSIGFRFLMVLIGQNSNVSSFERTGLDFELLCIAFDDWYCVVVLMCDRESLKFSFGNGRTLWDWF
jgi:hypothetical protein